MSAYLQGTDLAAKDKAATPAPAPSKPVANKAVTIHTLATLRAAREKITMLTCYDASFASLMDRCGVEILLIGDSLGMVCNGHNSTLPVTVAELAYHTASVARGAKSAMIMSDLPFGAYGTPETAYANAVILMQAGAHMIKLEGGGWTAPVVQFLVERGVPVCAHLGLTPQTVHALGGYRVQGRDDVAAATLRRQAAELQDMGASMLVLEMVPAELSRSLTQALPHCHTIGIGAGSGTAGQVLVMHDMLGVNLGKNPKFVHNFMQDAGSVRGAIEAYVRAVKSGEFPNDQVHAW